ncbi:protein unc-13 homolog C-like [Macrosteles quadrilineatus]|uniref:protein unc-13 homolog C-like n=1 Tax=Macrosteles quadrilineatus TaxID=74068 RepID=UPI0023E1CAE3|nr:protein unc-13 homolog C-like [Macrosteles quadrilineatus]
MSHNPPELLKKIEEVNNRLVERTDDLEQYLRRDNIRIFGVKETKDEITDEIVVKLCREKLGVELSKDAISRSHRVGKLQTPGDDGRERHRPIIVRFSTYRARRTVFDVKKRLKGTGVTIKEDLTHLRQQLYKQAVARFGVGNVWTQDGRVLWVDKSGEKKVATSLTDLPALAQNTASVNSLMTGWMAMEAWRLGERRLKKWRQISLDPLC